ncbi:MAG: hypothetical protein ACTSX2_04450 [Candidatus Thorarchaeota archaeon]
MLDKRRVFHDYFGDSETADIAVMHDKFWSNVQLKPSVNNKKALLARADFMQEELDEFRAAVTNGDFLEEIDALIDITVVAKGTAVMMGLRWERHWDEVYRANMEKVVGENVKRPDMAFDLIKPCSWSGPDHRLVLEDYGLPR